MKRLITLFLALLLLSSLAACGEGGLSLDFLGKGGSSDSRGAGGEDGLIRPDEDGIAVGRIGDTLRTAFFDMTVTAAYTCGEFDGLTPTEGYKFLVAELTLYNYTDESQPIFDTDFEVMWDLDDDDAWAWPECDEVMNEDGEVEYFTKSDRQLPIEYSLVIDTTYTGLLLYQVPQDTTEYYIDFYEAFDNGTEEGEWGDAFFVEFSAEERGE